MLPGAQGLSPIHSRSPSQMGTNVTNPIPTNRGFALYASAKHPQVVFKDWVIILAYVMNLGTTWGLLTLANLENALRHASAG